MKTDDTGDIGDISLLNNSRSNLIDAVIHIPKAIRFPMDIYEWRDQYVITIEVPGLIEETATYKIDQNLFTFSAQLETIPGGSVVHLNERHECFYRRSFVIPLEFNTKTYHVYIRNGLVVFQFEKHYAHKKT